MIKFENMDVVGWEAAVRGMRNPMNSWDKSDSFIPCYEKTKCHECEDNQKCASYFEGGEPYKKDEFIGPNDYDLMTRLHNAGTDHRKFMRMITVYVDITAPLYWWAEYDTYKVGTDDNSCSTMHKISAKEFTLDDFSHEHLVKNAVRLLNTIIDCLNQARDVYNNYDKYVSEGKLDPQITSKKQVWWQMIQLLPSSYNQRRTVMLNYEVLANIYKSRRNHKLDEWHTLRDWIKGLPYSELITGKEKK